MSEVQRARFETLSEMQTEHSRLLQRQREDSHSPSFIDDVYHFLERGQHTGKLLDESKEREAARTMIAFWATRLVREGRELPDIALDDFDPTLAPELPDEPCPYQGLEAFKNDQFFHGREDTIKNLLKLLNTGCRLLTVVGPSGSGKSSAILGGLVPALKAGAMLRSSDWKFTIMVPGTDPVANLNSALGIRAMEEGSVFVPEVVVVDQFEEVFTLATLPSRTAFEERLMDLYVRGAIIILTLRSDYASDDIAKLQQLHPVIETGLVELKALSIRELRDAILKPAMKVGLKFENGIVDDMVAKVLGERAGLPLLQFALLKLWENRDHNRITWDTYKKVGDPLQALKRSAETFYAGQIPQVQNTVRRTLLKMVKPANMSTEVTSSRVAREEIYRDNDARENVDAALEALEKARLIRVTGQGTQLEVAHEALIRNWPTLVQWLDEERIRLRQRFLLREKAYARPPGVEDTSTLLRGRELEDAEGFKDLDGVETDFVVASRAEVERLAREKEEVSRLVEKRLRRLTGMSILGSLIAVVGFCGYTTPFALGNNENSVTQALLTIAICVQPLIGFVVLILAIRWGVFNRKRAQVDVITTSTPSRS